MIGDCASFAPLAYHQRLDTQFKHQGAEMEQVFVAQFIFRPG